MIILNLAKVRAAGLSAYNEKRLSAQGPTPACLYRDASQRPCVVGAAMTDEEASGCSKAPVFSLVSDGFATTDNLRELGTGQELHDYWSLAAKKEDPDFKQFGYIQGTAVSLTAAEWEERLVTWLTISPEN